MADESKILPGEFKSIPIRIRAGSVTGGRETATKKFPNRDSQSIEDFGLIPRSYELEILISDVGKTPSNQGPRQTYFDYRDSLLAAIENPEKGVLIHPMYGRIENVKATVFSINENFSRFGDSVLTVLFEIDNDTGIPKQSVTALSQVGQAQKIVGANVQNDIKDRYSVSTEFRNNFIDAADKVNDMAESAVDATSFIGAASDSINDFNAFIGEFTANVNALTLDPNQLSLSVSNLFDGIDTLFGVADRTFEALANLFGFGDDDGDIIADTAGLEERKRNRGVINGAMNAEALSRAYVTIAQVDFDTTEDIDEVSVILDEQYDSVLLGGTSQEVKDSLTDMRVLVQDFFNERRLTTSQVIEVYTSTTSTRLLSYQYYGDSANANIITELNSFSDISFIEGGTRILSV